MRAYATKGVNWHFVGALAAGLLAVLLQSYRLDAPLSGYFGYNEGYYYTFALRDLTRGALAPMLTPQDSNNPFLFPLLLTTLLRTFGPSVAVARAISIAATLVAVLLTYWVCKQLYDRRAGFVAATVLAVSPGLLLAGRNIQIDPLMLMLEMAAVGAYLTAVKLDDAAWSVGSGVLLGLGLLTKLPVLLVLVSLAVWRTWSTRSWRWVFARSTWITMVAAAMVALPWYGYRAWTTNAYASAQGLLLERAGGWRGLAHLASNVLGEGLWMLSPVLALVAVAGLVVMATRRTEADRLVLAFVLTHVVVFAWYNKHSYYFMPLLPWASIAAARALCVAGSRRAGRVALAAALAVALILPYSVAELSAKKWSMLRLDEIPRILKGGGYAPYDTTPYASEAVLGGLGPAVDYHLGSGGYANSRPLEAWKADDRGRPVALAGPGMPAPGAKEIGVVPMQLVSPVGFGWAVKSYPGRTNYYALSAPELQRVGPIWEFGTVSETLDERIVVLWALPDRQE